MYAAALQFPFTETNSPSLNLYYHGNASVHKVRSMKSRFAKFGVEEFENIFEVNTFELNRNDICSP